MGLQVEGLTIYYQTLHGDVKALDGVSFSLADGEIMGVAGESGCGKSTLGNGLIRLAPPMRFVSGSVRLDGADLPVGDFERMNEFRFKKLSIIPQYAMNALNPTRKIGRITRDLLEAHRVNYDETLPELKHRLDLVGLDHEVLKMYPIELSGGMKQRMVMVLSTLLDPSLLIADEITSALDVSTQKAVAEMVVGFRDLGYVRSTMVITHDISVLYQIADSILVMYAGKLAEKAPTETIIHAPRHPYSRLLISALPKVGIVYTDKRLTGIPGNPPLLLNPPLGCRFRERCPLVGEDCTEEPPFIQIAKDHYVACWRETDHGQ